MQIRFGQIIENTAFEYKPGKLKPKQQQKGWESKTFALQGAVIGTPIIGTVKQARGSKVTVEFHNGKKAQTAIVTTPNARYIVLEGGSLKLGDTKVKLNGDKFEGKITEVRNPAPKKINPQDITRQAFLLTAGVGSRFEPVSGDITNLPKPAVPLIGEESIAKNIVNLLNAHGMDDITVHTFYKRGRVHESLKGCNGVNFMNDREAPGSAGALYKAIVAKTIDADKPMLVIGGDAVTNGDFSHLIRKHAETKAAVTIAVQEVSDEDVPNFGIIKTDNPSGKDSGEIESFIEKPSLEQAGVNRLGSTGIYVLGPETFTEIQKVGDAILKGKGKLKKSILDKVPALQKELEKPQDKRIFDFGMHFMPYWLELGKQGSKLSEGVHMYAEVMPGYWNDAGNPIDYLRSVNDIARGLMGSKLAKTLKQFYQDGVLFWDGMKKKAQKDGAELKGNVIVTPLPKV